MRAPIVRRIGWFAALALVSAPALLGSPMRDPKRLVNERTVDLNPLFQWWTKHNGPRPLTAWVHLSGPIVGTNAFGWVVEAQVEGGAHSESAGDAKGAAPSAERKIILRNPPWQELAEFARLSAQLKTLTNQRVQLANAEAQAKTRAEADAKTRSANRHNRSYSRALAADERQSKQTETQARDQVKILDQQIADTKKKLSIYPSADHYAVDCFALDAGSEFSQMQVYDHGQIFK